MRQQSSTPEILGRFEAAMAARRNHNRRRQISSDEALGRQVGKGQGKTDLLAEHFSGVCAGVRAKLLPVDSWAAHPPTVEILGEYLQLLKVRSPSWRTYSVQALRGYLEHAGQPHLAELVCLPRPVKGA